MIHQVDIRSVKKDLIRTPKALVIKFQKWVDNVEKYGLKWRAVYVVEGDTVKIVKVIGVHAHEY